MQNTRNRSIVIAITETGMTIPEAAARHHVSTRWVRSLLARYRTGGLAAVDDRSRRPHTNPHTTDPATTERILELRKTLIAQGLDAGAESIADRLPTQDRPSVSTIWRILKRHHVVTPQPQKRPRTSWHRFQADRPNETWQSDFTHWPLTDGTDVEIISWLDDHSRYLLHSTAHPRITSAIVIDTFLATTDEHDPPASTLTDNGMVYTARFARGNDGSRAQPNGFEQLIADMGITQKNGAVNHPTTQGKIERFHQTLKRWLAVAAPTATIDELNERLRTFALVYNTQRPHRAIGRRTPAQAYAALPKATPTIEIHDTIWRIRYDKVDTNGTLSLRYAGKLRHLAIGRGHAHTRVLMLIHNNETLIADRDTGLILAEHTIDPHRDYQPKKK